MTNPTVTGDLELINHSAGSLTSQAYHKRWNRQNELLADAAEKTAVAATWMGGLPYPQKRLNDAWLLVLGGQFHRHRRRAPTRVPMSLPRTMMSSHSTSFPMSCRILSNPSLQNDTKVAGTPIVVYNPLRSAQILSKSQAPIYLRTPSFPPTANGCFASDEPQAVISPTCPRSASLCTPCAAAAL